MSLPLALRGGWLISAGRFPRPDAMAIPRIDGGNHPDQVVEFLGVELLADLLVSTLGNGSIRKPGQLLREL
jgi:hypothetical protein